MASTKESLITSQEADNVTKEPLIEFKDVERYYPMGKDRSVALVKVNFSIMPGEFVSLVGPSGAGKSTLVRLLIREEVPNRGQIIVAGRDITKLRPRDLPYYRRRMGVVFQDFKLISHLTVKENIAFALEVSDATDLEIQDRIPKILELVGLTNKANSYPHQLSGGEMQRVAIARALIHSPKIVIADEPTGNLDPENTREVVELLKRINASGTLVILATHNQSVVDGLKHRVITIIDGTIASDQRMGGYKS